jgi:hypothetical protein
MAGNGASPPLGAATTNDEVCAFPAIDGSFCPDKKAAIHPIKK